MKFQVATYRKVLGERRVDRSRSGERKKEEELDHQQCFRCETDKVIWIL